VEGRGPTVVSGAAEPLVNLNARIPRRLHRRVRLLWVEQDREMREFVAEALRESLRRRSAR